MRVCHTGLHRKIAFDHLGQFDRHEIAAEGACRHGLGCGDVETLTAVIGVLGNVQTGR